MEDFKNVQNNAEPERQGSGRRRRHKKKKHGNQNGGERAQNAQAVQGAQNTQKSQNSQKEQVAAKGANGQKQNKQQGGQKNQNAQQQSKKQKQSKGGNAQNDNRKDTYAYVLDGNLYINLTNKCSNGCDFCVRNERSSYYGHYLWLKNDPTPEKVIAQVNGLGDLSRFKEVVFCGFGEPTYRVAEMVALCDYFHEKGLKTRLNTNGQGNLINKRDIVPELKDKLDMVNVSLNASCAEKYQPICRSQFGEAGFTALVDFARSCKKSGINCRFSIVDCIGEAEVEACKRLAESVRVPLYIRNYITDSE